jgi:hypothetical protein
LQWLLQQQQLPQILMLWPLLWPVLLQLQRSQLVTKGTAAATFQGQEVATASALHDYQAGPQLTWCARNEEVANSAALLLDCSLNSNRLWTGTKPLGWIATHTKYSMVAATKHVTRVARNLQTPMAGLRAQR